jgi:hypothetical protein
MGKFSRIISRGFWCGIMNIHNNKLVHDALKTKENIYILIYINV